jgi:hypothetical protein
MFSLKAFLDSLVDENHPFRKGPDLREGSALPPAEAVIRTRIYDTRTWSWEEKLIRFRYMRINKN